jgi:predicted permease
MLRLLPVAHPAQLVLMTDPAASGIAADTTQHGVRSVLSYPEFEQLRTNNEAFSGILASESQITDLDLFLGTSRTGPSIKARGQLVSGEFFQVLGIQPILGRTFTPDEDRARGESPVAVVSYDFWKMQLAARPDAIGSQLTAGQGVFNVIGIAPPGFNGILVGTKADIWFPMTMQQQVIPGRDYLTPHDTLWLQVMGRLAPGVSLQSAQASINVTFQHLLQEWAPLLPDERNRKQKLEEKIELRPGARGASSLRDQFSDPLTILMAMVGVVLLIASANLANLMLARANGRQREISVRLALGASRVRLVRQLMTESLFIGLLGGALGFLLAVAGTGILLALVSPGVDDLDLAVPLDYRVLGFTAAISILTSLLFGLAPALRASRGAGVSTVLSSGRSLIGGRVKLGRVLVVAQVALSLVLVMGAALFARCLRKMLAENLGFERGHILLVTTDPVAAGYKGASTLALYNKLLDSVRNIPGVRGATVSNQAPFGGGDSGDHLAIEGSPVTDREELASQWTEVGPDYFSTLGIPLLRGREITPEDATGARQVCVINQSFAKTFFPDSDPIGRHITDLYPTTIETYEIVGVVADAREHWPTERNRPRFYANLAHPIGSVDTITLLVRASGDTAVVAPAIRQTLGQVDANLPIIRLRAVDEQVDVLLVMQRLVAQLAAFFGGVSLFMAAIGLYGVLSYSTGQRRGEIGIRMALGAAGPRVVRMILGEAFGMVGIGVVIGLAGAIGASRLISSQLFGLSGADPLAAGVATGIILVSALFAAYIPARRASRIDPMLSLKYE